MAGKAERGSGRVFLRGSTFWFAYWGPGDDGTWSEIRESAKSTDEALARKLLSRRILEVRNHRSGLRAFEGPTAERLTVAQLLDALELDFRNRSIKGLRVAIAQMKPLREAMGSLRAVRLSTDRVRSYMGTRRAAGKACATVNRETGLLGRAFRLAKQDRRIAVELRIPSLPEHNVRQGFFDRAEVEALLPHLPAPLGAITRFGYMTGWRRGEILALTWQDVDREAAEIRLSDSKNGEGRLLPLDEPLSEIVAQQWKAREFTRRDGSTGLSTFVFHRNGKPVDSATFGRQWRTACDKAKLPGRLFHDLRRSAVRGMIRAGVPQSVAMSISGHKTNAMFSRYNITSTDDKLEALRRRQEREAAVSPPISNVRELRAADSDKDSDR
jgi:integrase